MTPPQALIYGAIGAAAFVVALDAIILLLIWRWMRDAPSPPTSLNYTPTARQPYVNGKTAEKEQAQ